MQTEAVFENIAERIQQEISKAQKSVFIAVAWFTNKNLFNELVNKARNGCTVSLIISNDNINLNSSIDFEQLLGRKRILAIQILINTGFSRSFQATFQFLNIARRRNQVYGMAICRLGRDTESFT